MQYFARRQVKFVSSSATLFTLSRKYLSDPAIYDIYLVLRVRTSEEKKNVVEGGQPIANKRASPMIGESRVSAPLR